jgi:hypothetical protein
MAEPQEPIRPVSQGIVNNDAGVTTGTAEQQQDALEQYVEGTELPVTSDGLALISIESRSNISSISAFLAQNQVTGFAKANRFLVTFNFGNTVLGNLTYGDLDRLLTFKCEQAEFPGREFVTTDARIYGPTYKSPNMSSYGDINLTLLCDNALTQKQLFETWMSLINSPYSFDFNYRDSYVAEVTVEQYNEINKESFVCTLREAYPVSVTALSANWADDQVHKLQVTLTYRYWVSEIVKTNDQKTYDELQQAHIQRVKEAAFYPFERNFFKDDNTEHLRKIARAGDNSRNNFRRIIDELAIESE